MRFDLSQSWAPDYIDSLSEEAQQLVEKARADLHTYPYACLQKLATHHLDVALALFAQEGASNIHGLHYRLTDMFNNQDAPTTSSSRDYQRRCTQLLIELINQSPRGPWRFSGKHCALTPYFEAFSPEELPELFEAIDKSQRTHILVNYLTHDQGRWRGDTAHYTIPTTFLLHVLEDLSSKKIHAQLTRHASQFTAEHIDPLLDLLEKGKKGTRQGVTDILTTKANFSNAQIDRLRAVREKEKDEKICAALDTILPAPAQAPQAPAQEQKPVEDRSSTQDLTQVKQALAKQRAKKLPNYIDDDALPTLTWNDDTPLNPKEQAAFYARLALESPDYQDDLSRQVAALLDPDKAGALSEALWNGFLDGGEKSSHKWLVYQLGVIGDDRVWRDLCPQLDERSAGHGYHQVEWVLESMARRESIEAASWLWYVARSAKRSRAADPATSQLRKLAHAAKRPLEDYVHTLQWDIAQEAEDEAWKIWLDDFPSTLPVSASEQAELLIAEEFQLVLRLPSGKIQKSVPKGAPATSKETFKELKKSLTARKHEVIAYIERMMISGRTWDKKQFEALFFRHPWMGQVASSLVFIDPETQATCRYSEGAFVDVEWEAIDPFAKGGSSQVALLHPSTVPNPTLEKWADHLADGEIVALVQQISRPHFSKEDEPASAQMPANTVLGRIERQGWILGGAGYDDAATSSRKRFPELGIDITASHPAIYSMGSWEDKTTGLVKLTRVETSLGEKLDPKTLSALAYSEICLAMVRLTE